MKKKSYSFIRSCFNYILIAIVLGNIPNLCMITVVTKTSSPALGLLYSTAIFTVIALLNLDRTNISSNFDREVAIMMLIMSCASVLITAFAFYNTSLLFNALSEADKARFTDYSDYEVIVLRLWIVSIGLGLSFGLSVLSGGSLLYRPQEKRKVEDLF
jgi:hypothetical protein